MFLKQKTCSSILMPPLWMLEHEKIGQTYAGSKTSFELVDRALAEANKGSSIAFFILNFKY